MIHIQRTQPPSRMNAPGIVLLKEGTKAYFTGPNRKRGPRPFQHYSHSLERVRPDLEDLFHGKCAWCETKLVGVTPAIGLYRPRQDALGLRGEIWSDLYWWLAYEWNNLYLACSDCERSKGTRFPLADEARRATQPGEERREQPLLLDPCADRPEQHLLFMEDGRIAPVEGSERGRLTIEIYGLNRGALVEARKAKTQELEALLERHRDKPEPVLAACEEGSPFAAVARQAVANRIQRGLLKETLPAPDWLADLTPRISAKFFSNEAINAAGKHFEVRQMAQEKFSVEAEENVEEYFVKTRLLERIEIENFKAIEKLSLKFLPETGEASGPWTVLLGENSSGKSTILEAVALALAGERHANALGQDASTYVCRNADAKEGRVRVWLTGRTDPIEMSFRKDAPRFEHSDKEPKVLLLAYGATRLLPTAQRQALRPSSQAVRVENLFDPFRPLGDPDGWLGDPASVSDDEFHLLRQDLEKILKMGDEEDLIRGAGRVQGKIGGVKVPLRQLSAGYQSVIAVIADIMSVMHFKWKGHMGVAQGIVLLDEIGEHLHPAWKKQIVKSLREVFPQVQFVATTHDPLCLRGVRNGEVILMRRARGNRIHALADLPPVEGMRVDQILTSEFFGLGSVYDENAEVIFREYYDLLARRALTPEERKKLEERRAQVDALEVLGTTRRDRMLLEEIDRYLAGEAQTTDAISRQELKRKMRENIAELWKQVEGEKA